MSTVEAINLVVLIIVAGICLVAAWSDFRRFEIPNRYPGAILLLFPLYVMFNILASQGVEVRWIASLGIGLAIFGAFVLLFAFGKMGGGDVKFAGAISLWAGPTYAVQFILIMSLGGLALSIAYALACRFGWRQAPQVRSAEDDEDGDGSTKSSRLDNSIPYGVAIATAGIFVIIQLIMK